MAMNIEKLFNFDEQSLTRDLAGQKADAQFGALMPKGYGAVGAGFNSIVRGLFGSQDPALQEQTKVNQAFKNVNDRVGDTSDPIKLYEELLKELSSVGASPRSIAGVAQILQENKTAQSSIDSTNLLKEMTIASQVQDRKTKNELNLNKLATKKLENLSKAMRDPTSQEFQLLTEQITSMGIDEDSKEATKQARNQVFIKAEELLKGDKDYTVSKAISEAGTFVKNNYDVNSDSWKIGDDSSISVKQNVSNNTPKKDLSKEDEGVIQYYLNKVKK